MVQPGVKMRFFNEMRRRYRFILAAGLSTALIAGAGCATTNAPDAATIAADAPDLDRTIDIGSLDHAALDRAILIATNRVRADAGLSPLAAHPVLASASVGYARRMSAEGFLGHHDPQGGTPKDRVTAAGMSNALPAENIAEMPALQVRGQEEFYVIDPDGPVLSRTPDGPPIPVHTYASFAAAAVQGWMESSGHRANLLSEDAVEHGCGAAIRDHAGVPYLVVVQKFQLYEPLE
jgi:uncharacterized protein YkwD